jgi:hypothetical protein
MGTFRAVEAGNDLPAHHVVPQVELHQMLAAFTGFPNIDTHGSSPNNTE